MPEQAGIRNRDFCVADAVLYQLSYQATWEQVATPVDVEIDDDNTGIFHVFEMQIGMYE